MARMSFRGLQVNQFQNMASICRESFYEFVQEFWSEISQETPVWNWHVGYLCDEMQKIAERVFRNEDSPHDTVINIPPGMTKSSICSEMFPAWVWTRMPHAQFICGSHTSAVALDLARRTRDICVSAKYKSCFPDFEVNTAVGHLINNSKGFRIAVGTGGITGFHAHFVIIDDPIDPQATNSEAERTAAVKWVAETLPSRKVNKAVAPTILIQQRLHQADPSGLMLNEMTERKWGAPVHHICLPASLEYGVVKPAKLARRYVNGLLDPKRLSKKEIAKLRTTLGKFGASCQLDQNPVPMEGGQIDTSKFRYETPPHHTKFKMLVRYWDKAGTHNGGKRTAGVLMGEDNEGRFWVLDVHKGQWASGDRERHIKTTADMDGYRVIVGMEQEPGSGGKESAENTVKNLKGYVTETDRPTGDKSDRADPFAAQVDVGNVYLRKGAPWVAEYVDELKYFPNGEFSDQMDGTSGAFNMLNRRSVRLGAYGRNPKK